MIERELLEALVRLWPTVATEDRLIPGHCIIATRVALEVGRYFGFPDWEALPVDLIVFNKAGFAQFRDDIPVAEWPSEAWSIGSMWDEQPGHLIVATPEHLADLSANQYDRPHRSLRVEPWVVERPDFEPPWWFESTDGNWSRIMPRPDVSMHKSSPNWRQDYKPFAGEIIRLLRHEQVPSSCTSFHPPVD